MNNNIFYDEDIFSYLSNIMLNTVEKAVNVMKYT